MNVFSDYCRILYVLVELSLFNCVIKIYVIDTLFVCFAYLLLRELF